MLAGGAIDADERWLTSSTPCFFRVHAVDHRARRLFSSLFGSFTLALHDARPRIGHASEIRNRRDRVRIHARETPVARVTSARVEASTRATSATFACARADARHR